MDADRLAEIKANWERHPPADARTVILALVAEVERLQAENARLQVQNAGLIANIPRAVADEVQRLQAENDELKQGEPCFLLVHASDGTPYPTVRALGPPEAVAALEAAIGTADDSPPIPELNNGSLVRAYGQTWRVNGCGSGSDPRTHEIKSFSVHFDLVKAENDGR